MSRAVTSTSSSQASISGASSGRGGRRRKRDPSMTGPYTGERYRKEGSADGPARASGRPGPFTRAAGRDRRHPPQLEVQSAGHRTTMGGYHADRSPADGGSSARARGVAGGGARTPRRRAEGGEPGRRAAATHAGGGLRGLPAGPAARPARRAAGAGRGGRVGPPARRPGAPRLDLPGAGAPGGRGLPGGGPAAGGGGGAGGRARDRRAALQLPTRGQAPAERTRADGGPAAGAGASPRPRGGAAEIGAGAVATRRQPGVAPADLRARLPDPHRRPGER